MYLSVLPVKQQKNAVLAVVAAAPIRLLALVMAAALVAALVAALFATATLAFALPAAPPAATPTADVSPLYHLNAHAAATTPADATLSAPHASATPVCADP